MSEPVIPERWRGVLERLRKSKYFCENKALPQRLAIPIQLIGELSAAEAKVAEQAATIAKEESRSNELAKEVAILRVDLKGQAATIERLTKTVQYCWDALSLQFVSGHVPDGIHQRAIAACRAALSKQEPAVAKEGE